MTDPDKIEAEKSINAIREIDELTGNPGFQAYRYKIERKAFLMADSILDGDISSEEREELRLKRIGLLSGLRMLADDREGHASILRSHGIEV